MYEMQSCEVCRWFVPEPGAPPPVPRENKVQRGECALHSSRKFRWSDQWCGSFTQKVKEKEKKR